MKSQVSERDEYLRKMELSSRAITDLAIDIRDFFLHLELLDDFNRLKLEQRLKLDQEVIDELPLYISEFMRLSPMVQAKKYTKRTWNNKICLNDQKYGRTKTYRQTVRTKQLCFLKDIEDNS